jgi:chitodextrinase
MKKNYFKGVFIILFAFFTQLSLAQTKIEAAKITGTYDTQKLTELQGQLLKKAQTQKSEAIQMARQKGWDIQLTLPDGSFSELQKIASDGSPIYYTTFNVAASISTRTNFLNNGGGLGLNLEGQNMTAYVWDGGLARGTHQEYDGTGGNNRFSIGDGTTTLNYHSAHVTGTIIASGVQANAKGMAPQAKAVGHDWNSDVAEATGQAAAGMLVSNHSYGFRGDLVPDYYFGAYIEDSRDWDNLQYNSPYYLMVVAAGNDGNQNSYNGAPLAGNSSYDKLTGHSTSKNTMVVANAQDATINADGTLASVTINSSSSEGPTDDYRIKPDITGNGTGVYSTYESSDSAYNSITGTSMASPNVAGSLLLLQQHYNNLNGNFMRAASLKGLALHTADDIGPAGPDAVHGWGLMNSKKAAETISTNGNGSQINELTLNANQTYTTTVDADGINDLQVSISWTDAAGIANTGTVNLSTPVLVNDLDVRITQNTTTYSPYKLTSVTTTGTGDNNVDPYERVDVVGATGNYTITVTHKGSLSNASQDYTLIVTGISSTPVVCEATTPTAVNATDLTASSATVNWNSVAGATYDLRHRVVGTTTWTTTAVSGISTTLTSLAASTNYETQLRSACSDGTTSPYSASVNFSTTELVLNYCASQGNNINDEYIARVQLGTIDNTSGAISGYTDFTSVSTDLIKGDSYTIAITPGWTATVYAEGYSVWIDYNKNGTFESSEQVFTQSATTTSPVSGSFVVPTSVSDGAVRMRVSMKYNGIPTACETFTYGQVEDYTVVLGTSSGPTPDTTPPSVPADLTATNITETTVDLSWSTSTDDVGVTGYNVYNGSTLLGTVTGTIANITGLTSNTQYTFSVSAIDAAANESATASINLTTASPAGDTQAPTAPSSLSAGGITQTTADLTWNAATDNVGVTAYEVLQNGVLIASTTTTSYTVTGLTAATTYSFTVQATDAAGNTSVASNAVNVTTQSSGTSTPVIITQGYFESGWDGWIDGGSDSYRYSGSNSYQGNYSIRIRDNSGVPSSMTLNNIDVSAFSKLEVEFYFYANSMEVGEDFWLRFYDGSNWNTVAAYARGTNFNNGTFYVATVTIDSANYNFASNSGFRFQCDASANGDQVYIDQVTITGLGATAPASFDIMAVGYPMSTNATAENEIDIEGDFLIYPNPVKGSFLNIKMPDSGEATYRILDIQGRLVKAGKLNNNVIEVDELRKGVYIIELNDGEETNSQQFIRQ